MHNGQITNYWMMRRQLERRGTPVHVELRLRTCWQSTPPTTSSRAQRWKTRLRKSSIEEIDGVFTYLVATKDELGMAKDTMAAKPMVLYESDDLVALASKEVAIRAIVPHEIDTYGSL